MNKEELINRLASVLGASAKEIKIAYDIFMQKISETLELNESIKIPELGIFQIKSSLPANLVDEQFSGDEDNYFLLYVPNDSAEVIPYYINYAKKSEADQLNSVFSLSTGKPFIPITESQKKELLVQSSYLTLQKNLEEKIENLFKSALTLDNFNIDVNSFNKNNEKEIQKDETNFVIIDDESEKKEEEIPWDFGPQFQNEKVEIPLNEFDKIDEEINKEVQEQNSVNEVQDDGIANDEINFEENLSNEFPESKNIDENELHEDFVELDETELFKDELIPNEINENKFDDFSEQLKIEENNLTEDENLIQHSENEIPLEEISGTNFDDAENPGLNENEITEEEIENENRQNELTEINEVDVEETPDEINLREKKFSFTEDEEDIEEKVKYPVWFWVVLASFVIVTAAGVYYFLFQKNENVIENKIAQKQKTAPQIIERDFEVPVTVIPQTSNSETAAEESKIAETENKESENKVTENKVTENKVQEEKPKTETQPEKQISKNQNEINFFRNDNKNNLAKAFIFTDGTKFTVQISSWKAQDKAENEVRRLRKAGNDAYLVRYERKPNDIWYRVRVGEFSSLEEAEKQLNKIK